MPQTVNLTPNVHGILRWAKSGLRAESSMRTRSARALLDVIAASVEHHGRSIGAEPCNVLSDHPLGVACCAATVDAARGWCEHA